MKEKYLGKMIKVLKKEAERNVNSACLMCCYQPKESEALLKLKKNKNS